jgi:hypothetical protein
MFDKAKLEALGAKYESARETDVAPERFRKPLAAIFGPEYRRAMPFAGVLTLLDLPHRPDAVGLPELLASTSGWSACRWISA